MDKIKYPREFLSLLESIKSKRPKTVIEHILKHGYITTEELQEEYGYTHGPRAARDVREKGIPLETYDVISKSTGRKIAAYKFGDLTKIRNDVLEGRKTFPKDIKKRIQDYHHSGTKCFICNTEFEKDRYLQVDHRVPYEVIGDTKGFEDESKYMLLCSSCNRAKSWSCEQCENWLEIKDPKNCEACYWGSPEKYTHIALREMRRLDMTFEGAAEAEFYDHLAVLAAKHRISIGEFVKDVLRRNGNT